MGYRTTFTAKNLFAMKTPDTRPVAQLDLARYMGLWHEIATYPKWFERGMTNVTAFYSLEKKGVRVENSGTRDGKRKRAIGKARTAGGPGQLKVSFFGPFYAPYWVIDLAEDYSWAVVSNPKGSTLWILCRTPQMDEATYAAITTRLIERGFDLRQLEKR